MRTPDAVPGPVQTPASHAAAPRATSAWQTHEALTLLVLGLLGWVVFPHLTGALLLMPWLAYGTGLLRGRPATR